MSRPYWMHRYHGYTFKGNRIHPEDLGWINAQLSAGAPIAAARTSLEDTSVQAHMILTKPQERHNQAFSSSVLERLLDQPELIAAMGRVAAHVKLPDHWKLSSNDTDGREDYFRDHHMDLLHQLGEAALEAPAA